MPIEDRLWPRADQWLARSSDEPELAVVGVPTSVASLTPSEGWRTPGRFREVLSRFSTYDGEVDVEVGDLAVADLGNWGVAGLELESSQVEIETQARELGTGPTYAFIGGDNAITRPLVRGLAGDALSSVGVLTFDSHHDVRLLDRGPLNGTPIRGLIEDGLPGDHVAQVGILSFANSGAYRDYCLENGVHLFTMADIEEESLQGVVAEALRVLDAACDWIYVDFDIDVLDRAFAPGCPGSRPGGMTPRQLAAAAHQVGAHARVRAADFVEVDPDQDVDDLTVMQLVAAFLAFASGVAARSSDG